MSSEKERSRHDSISPGEGRGPSEGEPASAVGHQRTKDHHGVITSMHLVRVVHNSSHIAKCG